MYNISDKEKCLYFAYGSNMDEQQMSDRKAPYYSKQKAVLPDYALAFNKRSIKDNSGKANIIAKKGSFVYGIVYELDKASFNNLIKFERGYDSVEFYMRFLESGEIVKCTAFICRDCGENIKPTQEYFDKIITPLKKNEFPVEYIQEIENI